MIDGLDINTLKLADLRSRLTIVAQESALFAGSLRFNLDPFSAYEDADIWDALRRVQMAAPVGATPRATPGPSRAASIRNGEGSDGGSEPTIVPAEVEERFVVKSLEMVVAEGGKNFSAGALSTSLLVDTVGRCTDHTLLSTRAKTTISLSSWYSQTPEFFHLDSRRIDRLPRPRH